MAYALHIEREERTISFDEWSRAVATVEEARLDSSGAEATNEKTGVRIIVGGADGDVFVPFKTKGFLGFGANSE